MRNILTFTAIVALGAGFFACGSGSSGPNGFGDDGGTSSSSGGSSGSSGGSGSSSGTSGGSSGSSSGGHTDGGSGSGSSSGGSCTTNNGPITGTVGATGGSVSRLVFGVVGDTRPPSEDDPSGYPTPIITSIFNDLQAQSPRPVLVLGTGDYQFSSTDSSVANEQLQDYMGARSNFSGAFFPAMGNHECGTANGACSSDFANCSGTTTANLSAFMSEMMQPIGQTKPYYSVNVNAADNSWTAKFVMTAANAWDSTQQSWLQGVLAQPTTYTFVVRHEPTDTSPQTCGSCTSTDFSCVAPGVAGVDALLTQYPYTMLFVGHTHNYGHYKTYFPGQLACGSTCPPADRAVVVGNGGAPITGSSTYGYVIAAQRCDGAMVVDEYNYTTNATDSYFHFVITPSGTITQ
jgi:hypothetical protein